MGPPVADAFLRSVVHRGRALFPGLASAILVALAARFLSGHYGAPVMLLALLLGMALGFLAEHDRCVPGIAFSSSTVLRAGVALLGLGLSIERIVAAGAQVFLLVVGTVAVTIAVGVLIARLGGQPRNFGLLTGGAVAICGASAALAIASLLPKTEDSERQTIFTVIGVTTLSTIAMVLYPVLSSLLDLSEVSAGVFIGATIHDVAQVVGAGYSISSEAGDMATIVKLMRVMMLVPLLLALALVFRGDSTAGWRTFPWFVVAFVVMALFSEIVPGWLRDGLLSLSGWCLVTAIAALGIKTSLRALAAVGGQAIILICLETLVLAVLVLAVLMLRPPV